MTGGELEWGEAVIMTGKPVAAGSLMSWSI